MDRFDMIKEIPQEHSSQETCHNHWQLPQLFKLATFEEGKTCVDYGGGKFETSVDFLVKDRGLRRVMVYDPFNRTAEHNQSVIEWARSEGGVDYVTSSNVLNVIKEEEVRLNVLRNMQLIGKGNAVFYFVTYEGDRSGIGMKTAKGWQNNRRTVDYLPEIRNVFTNVRKKGALIIAQNK